MKIEAELNQVLEQFKTTHPTSLFLNQNTYANWLAQTYFFVCHSTTLLGFALPHLKTLSLRHHFEHHIGEETKHELLVLKDIEKLGMKVDEFEEHPATSAFYQAQYYKIQFEGGTSLLGYILFLEAMACDWGKSAYEQVKFIYPQSSLFLKVHAEEDPEHVKKAVNAIMSLSPEEQQAVLRNLRYSAAMYQQIMGSLCKFKSINIAA